MKILLATDGSNEAENAARFLARLRWTADDLIAVFHAIYAVPFHSDESFYYSTLQAIKKQIAPKILDSALAILKHLPVTTSVSIEESAPNQCTPEQCIIRSAEALGADMIAMGARGVNSRSLALIGDVTGLVASMSSIPVLAVKPSFGNRTDGMSVLVAVDGPDHAQAIASFLRSLPFPPDTGLTIVLVMRTDFSDIPERFIPEIDDKVRNTVATARKKDFEHAEAIISETRNSLRDRFRETRVLSKIGDPATEILKAAESQSADLIVLGNRGLRGIRSFLGSVSRTVLYHADSSLLIVRTL